MPRSPSVAVESNFKRGLVTEATGLNFPEDACTETDNCVFDEKGRVTRRQAIDFETDHTTTVLDRTDSAIAGYTWNNAAGDGSVSFRIVQVGETLSFYRLISGTALSSQLMGDTVDLTDFASGVNESNIAINECQFTATSGYLVVTHPSCEPFYVAFDPSDDSLTATEIDPRIRDYDGVDDSLAVDERPTATVAGLTAAHKYNLFNQGWYFNSNAALTAWDTARSDMPSNADIWWAYKDSNGAFDAAEIANVDLGNTPAPKGHYLLNIFDQDRTDVSGISSIDPVTTGLQRFSAVAFFAGRLFYSGINAIGQSDKIYFTQIINTPEDFGKCHQYNDPTSETAFDLLPSDGGVISVLGIDSVIKMVPLSNVLLIFSTNGIWTLTGSEGLGFRANDYTLTKLSSVGCLTQTSFLDINGFPVWWNDEGIFSLTGAQSGFSVQSLTDETIRTFYKEIPTYSKRLARGDYNPISKVASWLYSSTSATGDLDVDYEFDRVLSYNVLTGAFYPWSFDTDSDVRIHSLFSMASAGGVQGSEIVTATVEDSVEDVVDEDEDEVEVYSSTLAVVSADFRFLVSYYDEGDEQHELTFARERAGTYLDFQRYDDTGSSYNSYFIAGRYLRGEAQRFFQSNYVYTFFEEEENSSCYLQGLWDWTTSDSTGKWSTPQQVYNSSLGNRSTRVSRRKVRGKGRALQLKFYSDGTKPFTVEGWSIFETQNNWV